MPSRPKDSDNGASRVDRIRNARSTRSLVLPYSAEPNPSIRRIAMKRDRATDDCFLKNRNESKQSEDEPTSPKRSRQTDEQSPENITPPKQVKAVRYSTASWSQGDERLKSRNCDSPSVTIVDDVSSESYSARRKPQPVFCVKPYEIRLSLLDSPNTPTFSSRPPTAPKSAPSLLTQGVTYNDMKSMNIHNLIGNGSFSEVFRVSVQNTHSRTKFYALKRTTSYCPKYFRTQLLAEMKSFLAIGRHQNLLRYYSAWEENDICYALCDFCENGSLDKKLHTETTNFTEDEIKRIIVDIASGLAHIHSKGFAHYDIKPANLLIDSLNRIVIGDLGQAFKLSDSSGSEGDGLYMAPEVLEGHHSFAADMYSFGMTLYEIITNYVIERGPFLDDLRSGKITFNPKKSVSKELEQLVIHLLSSNPNERPSAKDVLEMDFLKSFARKKKRITRLF